MLPTLLFASQRHSFNALSARNMQAFSLPISSQSPQVGNILILTAIELVTDIPITINTIYEADIDILNLPVDQIAEQTSVSFRRLYTNLLSIQRQNVVKFIIRPTLRSLRLSTNNHISSSQRTILHYICHGLDSQSTTGSILLYDEGADTASTRQKKIQLVSIDDVLRIVGDHALLVLDCNYAGSIITAIRKLDILENDNVLVIAATNSTERLPLWLSSLNCYPADVFTQCLLNPVKMYIFLYIRKICLFTSSLCTYEQCEAVYTYLQEPGKREFLNSINKILKLLCEAIAWSSLPRDTFNMIYRQDKCVSTLYTGFILAQRIMKDLRITAQSLPPFPDTTTHRLWDVFDTVFNANLSTVYTNNAKLLSLGILTFYFEQQTVKDIKKEALIKQSSKTSSPLTIKSLERYRARISAKLGLNDNSNQPSVSSAKPGDRALSKTSSISSTANQSFIRKRMTEPTSNLMVSFLQEQLRTFELWLLNIHPSTEIPDALPFVVVSIKIQQLRSKALDLVTHFIDMSPWCLRTTLELRLLQIVLHGVHTFHECESDQFRCILIICKIVVANYFTIPLIVNITKRRSGSGATASKGNIEDTLCNFLMQNTASTDMRILCLIILTCLTTDQAVIEARLRHASVVTASLSTRETPSVESHLKMPLHSGASSTRSTVCKPGPATLASGFGFYMPQNAHGDDPNTISECCAIMRESLMQKNMLEVLAVLVHSASEHIKLWSLLLLSELMHNLTDTATSTKKLRPNRLSSPALHSYTKTIPTSNSMVIATSSSNLLTSSTKLFSLTFLSDQIEEVVEPLRTADELVSSAHDNFKQPDSVIAYGCNYGRILDIYGILLKLLEPSMTAEIRAAAISVVTSSLPTVDLVSIVASHRVVDVFYPGDSGSEAWTESFSVGHDRSVNLSPPDLMLNISKLCVYDISPLVRHEALCCIARIIPLYFQSFLSLATSDLILAYDMYSNAYVKIFNGFHAHQVSSIIHTVYSTLKQAMYDPVSTISIRARHIFDSLSFLALCLLLQTTPITNDFFYINCRQYIEKKVSADSLTTETEILGAVKEVFDDENMQQVRLIMQKLSLVRDLSEKQIKHILAAALHSPSLHHNQLPQSPTLNAETEEICVDSAGVILKTPISQGLSMSQFSKKPGVCQPTESYSLGTTASVETSENSFVTASLKQKNMPNSDSSSNQSDIAVSDIDTALTNVEIKSNDASNLDECDTYKLEFFKEKFVLLQKLDAIWLELAIRVCMPQIVASIYNCMSVILTLSRNSVRFPSICFNIEAAAAVAAQEVHKSMKMCPMHSLLSINDRGASYYRMHNPCCPCGRPALASLPLFLRDYFISPASTKCLDFDPCVSMSLLSHDKPRDCTESLGSSSGQCSNSSRSEIISSLHYHSSTFNVLDSLKSNSVELEERSIQKAYIFNSNDQVSSAVAPAQEKGAIQSVWPSLFDLESRKLSEFDHARLRSYFHFLVIYLRNYSKRKTTSRTERPENQIPLRLGKMLVTKVLPPGVPPSEYSALHASICGVSFNAYLPKICESYLYAVKTNPDDMRRLSPSTPVVITDGVINSITSKEKDYLNVLSTDETSVLSLLSQKRKNISYLGNTSTSSSSIQKLSDHDLLKSKNSYYWGPEIDKAFNSPIGFSEPPEPKTNNATFDDLQRRVDKDEYTYVINHLCHFCRNTAVAIPLLTQCMDTTRIWNRNSLQFSNKSSIFHVTRDVNPLGTATVPNSKGDASGKNLINAPSMKKGTKTSKARPSTSSEKAISTNTIFPSQDSVQLKLQTTASPFPYLELLAYCEVSQAYIGDELMIPAETIYSGYLIPYVCSLALHALFFEFSNYLMISLNDTEQSPMLCYTQQNKTSPFTTDNNSSLIWTRNNFLMETHNRITAAINDIDYDRLSESLSKVRFLRLSDKQLGVKSASLSQKSISSRIQPMPVSSEGSFQLTQRSSSNSQNIAQEPKPEEVTDSTIIRLTTGSVPEGLFVMDMLPKVDSAHSIVSETISMVNLKRIDIPSQTTSRGSLPDAESNSSCTFMTELDLLKQLHTMYPEQRDYLSVRFAPVKKITEVQEILKKRTADNNAFRLATFGSNAGLRYLEKSTSLKKVKSISHCTGAIKKAVFHRNEAILLTNNGCTCCIWNTMTGELLSKLPLDLVLDIHPTSWPGGGLISGHVHTPMLAFPQGPQAYNMLNWVAENCTAPEATILANMLEADAASLECPHCCLLNASRSPDYGVLKNFPPHLLKVLHKQGCASAKDFDSEVLEKLFPSVDDGEDKTSIENKINAYSRMSELIRKRRGPYSLENNSIWLGDVVLLNQHTPHSVLAIAAADCTIRILTNYHDASLCRHTAAFNVGTPPSGPLYSSTKLQKWPYAVAEFYRQKFNIDMGSPDTVLNHHKKQYIIARSKICNALFHERKKPDEAGSTRRTGEWTYSPVLSSSIPILKAHSDLLEMHTTAPHIVTALQGGTEVDYIDLMHESKYLTFKSTYPINDIVPLSSSLLSCGVLVYGAREYSLFDTRSNGPIMSDTAPEPINGGALYNNILFLSTSSGRLLSKDTTTGNVLKQYSIPNSRTVNFHNTGLFSCVEETSSSFSNTGSASILTYNAIFGHVSGIGLGGLTYKAPAQTDPQCIAFHPRVPLIAVPETSQISLWSL